MRHKSSVSLHNLCVILLMQKKKKTTFLVQGKNYAVLLSKTLLWICIEAAGKRLS